MDNLFIARNVFGNGGTVQIMHGLEKDKPDYKDILAISLFFAKEGKQVKMLAKIHFKSDIYNAVFGSLIGTQYERKCPDILVDGHFYEYEGSSSLGSPALKSPVALL